MDPVLLIVTQLPLTALGAARQGASRTRSLGELEIKALLRSGPVEFVVAEVGRPLRWLPWREGTEFWKGELQPHLARPGDEAIRLDDFPGSYFYWASEWGEAGSAPVILCELSH